MSKQPKENDPKTSSIKAPEHTVLIDRKLIDELLHLCDLQPFATMLGWFSSALLSIPILMIAVAFLEGWMQRERDILLNACILISTVVVMLTSEVPGKITSMIVKRYLPPAAPRCPACDAAWLHDLHTQCSCCEAERISTCDKHWCNACPTCRIRPDAAVCWRCRQVVRLRTGDEVRALSLLRPPMDLGVHADDSSVPAE